MPDIATLPGPLGAVYRLYVRALAVLAVLLVGGIVAIMGTQVFFRYVLNDSLIWAEEVCGYLLVWTAFLFLGRAFERGELVAVNLVVGRFGRWGALACLFAGYGLVLAFLGMLVVYGYNFAEFNTITTVPAADFIWSGLTGSGETVDLSAYWIFLAVPIGCALLFLHVLFWLWGRLVTVMRGGSPDLPGQEA